MYHFAVRFSFKLLCIISTLLSFTPQGHCLFRVYPKIHEYPIEGGDPGEPLMLTPLIEAGKIQEAQSSSKMKPMKSNISSYSGFFTVDKQHNSNMFFWFFPAVKDNATAPVVLWLQGGPGASSLYGLFEENGPFSVKKKHGLKLRDYTWITSHSVLYIDNPVGTGFSFTGDSAGYSTNEGQVGANLYNALVQFFTLFPQFKNNDFFVTGESYGGKYVPAVSYNIHRRNPNAKVKINLKGLAIGNGFCDPEHMINYGDYLYQIGLLDSNGKDIFKQKEQIIIQNIQQKQWKTAFANMDALINGDQVSTSIFKNLTGFSFYFNYLHDQDYSTFGDIGKFLSYLNIRQNLHVGNLAFQAENLDVEKYLADDMMQSVKSPWIEELVENYRVLFYNGQLDIIVAYPLTEQFLDSLRWSGAAAYKTAPRKQWYVGQELAGYSKVVKNLTFLLVRNAGHMVPQDQPKWAVDMITRFTRNKLF